MKEDDKIADAFYNEDYKTLSKIFKTKITTQKQAEKEYEKWYDNKNITEKDYENIVLAIEKHYKKVDTENLSWTDYCLIWEREYFLKPKGRKPI